MAEDRVKPMTRRHAHLPPTTSSRPDESPFVRDRATRPFPNSFCAVFSWHWCLRMELYRQASASTVQALSMPVKWLSQYDEFIIKNASAVSQIESALRSLTYIIPGTKCQVHATMNTY